jgi:hypothetical protein
MGNVWIIMTTPIKRNHLAHQAYVLTLKEQHDDAILRKKTRELEAAHQRAKACLEGLQAEMESTQTNYNKVVKQADAELRARKRSDCQVLPEAPTIDGASDAT